MLFSEGKGKRLVVGPVGEEEAGSGEVFRVEMLAVWEVKLGWVVFEQMSQQDVGRMTRRSATRKSKNRQRWRSVALTLSLLLFPNTPHPLLLCSSSIFSSDTNKQALSYSFVAFFQKEV